MEFQLKKFNMDMIKDSDFILIHGSRETGKSLLATDILYNKKSNIPKGIIVCNNYNNYNIDTNINSLYKIYHEYIPNIISDLLEEQKLNKYETNSVLLLDDCIIDTKDIKTEELFINRRDNKVMTIFTEQYSMLRQNIDIIFILRTCISDRKKLYKQYAQMFPTFDMFCATLDKYTNNYKCLVICNHSKSDKLEDKLFWYKADIHKDF